MNRLSVLAFVLLFWASAALFTGDVRAGDDAPLRVNSEPGASSDTTAAVKSTARPAGGGVPSTVHPDGGAVPSAAHSAGGGKSAAARGGGLEGPHGIAWPGIDLPAYEPPEAYSVDLVMHSDQGDMVMKRSVDRGRIRTELKADGEDVVMIELGDEKGTMYTLMPGQKRAVKMSTAAMLEQAGQHLSKDGGESAASGSFEGKIEDLGDEDLGGRAVKKLRITTAEGSALGWFDKGNGAPVRLESSYEGRTSTMEWKNYQAGPQPAKQFEVPEGFEVMDMDQMMSQMKGMGAMSAMAGNYAGGMAQNFGQSMGSSFGASLGGALGGPLGAIAGRYIGGKVGGLLGKKAADAVIPGR